MLGKVSIFFSLLLNLLFIVTAEALVASQCREVNRVCIEHNSDLHPDIKKDCWKYSYELDCENSKVSSCNNTDLKSCVYVKERCLKYDQVNGLEICSKLERVYSCENSVNFEKEKIELLKNGKPVQGKELSCSFLCLDGNCNGLYKADSKDHKGELVRTSGVLSSSKDAKDNGGGNVNIFSATPYRCNKGAGNAVNCCSKGLVRNKSLGSFCRLEEIKLSKLRQEKRCVELGTYCVSSEVSTGFCKHSITSYCCYDSVISRILHQEAKKQLGKDNGTAANPVCGGVHLKDLQRVDFSKADFSDFYNDVLLPNMQLVDHAHMQQFYISSVDDVAKSDNGFNKN